MVSAIISESRPSWAGVRTNRAMLLLAAGQPQESLQVLLDLREMHYEPRTEGFRALALARIGSKREALAVLAQTERIFGRSELLSGIRENIDTHRPFGTAPVLSLSDDPVPGLRQAFESLARLDHVEQARVLQAQGQLELYILEHVREACASIVALAPMMSAVRREDDISAVLKQILISRFLLVQWTVADQTRGGYSKSGGVGERDIVISRGPVTLAVLEALIVDSVEAANLTSHFKKLFAYDTCRLFFHVTYARTTNCTGIVNHLNSACESTPTGITYLRTTNLPDFDSMPVGFMAQYTIDSREATVVFLVLDMSQTVQRAAAAAQ